jgi:DNA-binding Lrp family transcriptional regulator
MKNLNLRDYKILSELDKDSRASFNLIGRKLRLSPSVVERRVKNLLIRGVIRDFKTIIDYKKLGWTYYSSYCKFQNITEGKKEEIVNYLKASPLTGQCVQCDGEWQLIYGFFSKDIFQVNEEIRKFNDLFGGYIKETQKVVHIGSHHFYRGHLLGKNLIREKEPFLGGKETQENIGKQDLELLNVLRNNARINSVELSEKLKISLDSTRYKIKKLIESGIILGSWLHINPEKLNLDFYKVLLRLKHMNKETENKILSYLNNNKNVIRANNVFGSWDYFVDLEISKEDFRKFIGDFTNKFVNNIQEYETLVIYDEIKFDFSPEF